MGRQVSPQQRCSPALSPPERVRALRECRSGVAKGSYELRYGEPEGGVTLWDLTADAAVYEFGPEVFESEQIPEGVQEDHGDIFELTFEHPNTGEDFVIALVQVFDVVGSDSSESGSDETTTWSNDTSRWFIARIP